MSEPRFLHQLAHDFQAKGYAVAPGLFAPSETAALRDHYMGLLQSGAYPGAGSAADLNSPDPLKRYPRMLQMHRWDEPSRRWLLDVRLRQCLAAMLGRDPFAVQTMLYFKPPGARGQALHQDQYYLRVQPGTCVGAWLALDDADEANGCLQVVPGTHRLPVLCAVPADTSQSFTDVTVPLPEGYRPEPVILRAGDVFFFNGQVVHGSYPNTTPDRFRRSLIGHYIAAEAEKVYKFYHPVLRMDGTEAPLGQSESGSQCGVWVERDGAPVVELQGQAGAVGIVK
jgi:hypothetical protein